jgi:1-acyl-sn-glycerol-3-phosphate acyltransferase
MRSLLVALAILLVTPPIGLTVIVAGLLGAPDGDNSVYQWGIRSWARIICAAAGAKIKLHDTQRILDGPAVYVANHVSWFDVFALGAVLPRVTFVAKKELEKLPIFGRACRAAGIVFIERGNRRAAFDTYKAAADKVREGRSVVVCPEGTRGRDYHLRPFKKGPFVFAISTGAPIVPTIIHGTIAVQPKGSFRVHSGDVNIHFLEPVPTAGYSYEQRAELMAIVWQRMADALHRLYGIQTSEHAVASEADRPEKETSFL